MTEAEMTTIAALIDRWHFETFHGSIVARDTAVWNLVYAAKEGLKVRLAAVRAIPLPEGEGAAEGGG